MKLNKVLELLFVGLFFFFITLYITTMSNYQEYENKKTNILTEEAIKRFEEDVSNGKKIIASNYLNQDKDYNNKISSVGLKLSNFIEKTYKKTINKIFKKLSAMIEE